MLTVQDALQKMLDQAGVMSSVRRSLADSSASVLAETLVTPHDSPPFDKSMMDGFVVKSEVVHQSGQERLTVLETITAGTLPAQSPGAGTACRIMTGAPLPAGTDCVVPIERTTFDEQQPGEVTIAAEYIHAEQHVLRQGASATAGSPLLDSGTQLQAQHIAVLAEFGITSVPVFRTPGVAVLATGDELIAASEPLTPGRIRNSNEPMLVAQIQRAGANAVPLGIARDNVPDLSAKIASGLQQDVLLLSGGVSAGTLDLVPSQLQSAGVREVFHKIRMKPGKPLWFGILETNDHRCLVVGLPGNPVSSMVCFEVFVRPMLDQMSGRSAVTAARRMEARLTEDISIRGDRPTYFPSRIERTDDGVTTSPVKWGGSADLRSTAQANGVSCLDPIPEGYRAGQLVPVLCWDSLL